MPTTHRQKEREATGGEEGEPSFEPKRQLFHLLKMATREQKTLEHSQTQMQRLRSLDAGLHGGGSPVREEGEDEMSRSALSTFRAKEEEIERKKMEVRDRVQAHLGRVEEETKRLAEIREELEGITDPMRKEVMAVRKKIDIVNKELKPLGLTCQKKERDYREAVEALNEKTKEKAQLVNKLMELVTESERLRMKKLEELSRNIENLN